MGFDWECYLSLAEVMNDIAEKQQDDGTPEGFREACQRSAISRSYYGVFCSARNLLRKYVPKIPEVDTHKFVREKYLNCQDTYAQKVHDNLLRLWDDRKIADYENEMDTEVDVEAVNDLAARTMKRIKKLESEAFLTFSEDP
jgi:uncharacterized protein (UPF0332 family)